MATDKVCESIEAEVQCIQCISRTAKENKGKK